MLRQMDATLWAIAQAFADKGGAGMAARDRLERLAFPWERDQNPFVIRGSDDAGT